MKEGEKKKDSRYFLTLLLTFSPTKEEEGGYQGKKGGKGEPLISYHIFITTLEFGHR